MSAAMDKALMAMSIKDEEVPFNLPDLPEFSSCERNELSLIGRILNPDCQSVSGVVYDMPRKWQKYDRVRGIALSKEKFQFIFKSEHDLEDVLQKGFHTYNEWGLAVERWSEFPPSDSLQFVNMWVQIRNIPINHYTAPSITAIAEIIGQVIQVAFDPSRAQGNDYVRAQIRFDVSKPLRKSKVIGLPHNKSTEIFFNYERVQKRCYYCQRLSHEKDFCPILIKNRQDTDLARRMGQIPPKPKFTPILKESDPLFGVLGENQIGINPISGRPRIAPEVLEGMRQYLLISNGEDRLVKEERVRRSVGEAEKSPFTQKSILSLEPIPLISHDVDKGKGIVFGYDSDESSSNSASSLQSGQKILAANTHDGGGSSWTVSSPSASSTGDRFDSSGNLDLFKTSSSVYRIGFVETSPSGSSLKKRKPRKRQSKKARLLKGRNSGVLPEDVVRKIGLASGNLEKRKAVSELDGVSNAVKAKTPVIVPKEGLSKF